MTSTEMVSTLMRRFRKHTPLKEWDEIDAYFKFSEKDTLYCEYCKVPLLDEEPFPYKRLVSVDHRQSRFNGGSNKFDNIAICCCRCNIVKGTMNADTFRKFHNILDLSPKLKEEVFDGLYWGRRANMINRHAKTPKSKRCLSEFV